MCLTVLFVSTGGLPYDRAQVIYSGEILNFGMRPGIRHKGSGISNRAIVVRSEYPIDLFGSNEEKFSHDCFLIFPTRLLSKQSSDLQNWLNSAVSLSFKIFNFLFVLPLSTV